MGELNPKIELLLTDFCTGRISDADMDILNRWMDASETNRDEALRFLRLYRNLRAYEAVEQVESGKALERIMQRVGQIRRKRRQALIRQFAAVFVLLVMVGAAGMWLVWNYRTPTVVSQTSPIVPGSTKALLILDDGQVIDLESNSDTAIHLGEHAEIRKTAENLNYQQVETEKVVFNTIRIPRGGKHNLVLSDGTKVWLNAETELRFPVRFIGERREITLSGEAYFEVTHNPTKPFLVHTSHSTVRVYGTSFNVMSYPDDQVEQTTLVDGSVAVSGAKGETTLSPGQQVQVNQMTGQPLVRSVDTNLYTAWKSGIFRFEAMELNDLSRKLARWYNVDFEFSDEHIKHRCFTGAVRENTDFTFFMTLIGETTDVTVTIDNRTIKVASKKH